MPTHHTSHALGLAASLVHSVHGFMVVNVLLREGVECSYTLVSPRAMRRLCNSFFDQKRSGTRLLGPCYEWLTLSQVALAGACRS